LKKEKVREQRKKHDEMIESAAALGRIGESEAGLQAVAIAVKQERRYVKRLFAVWTTARAVELSRLKVSVVPPPIFLLERNK